MLRYPTMRLTINCLKLRDNHKIASTSDSMRRKGKLKSVSNNSLQTVAKRNTFPSTHVV